MEKEKPRTIRSFLASYDSGNVKKIIKLCFEGVEHLDVYNITAPFKVKRTNYLLGRVELRDFEVGSLTIFFCRPFKGRIWHKCDSAPVFNLQDPFKIKCGDTLIIGGVEIMQKSVEKGLMWRNVFYKGSKVGNLKRFAHGPWGMKGIRFAQINNGEYIVFTRPQGKKGRRGKIGFRIINSLSKLTPRRLSNAKIIEGMFSRGEWGGVNEIHILENNKLGILGHIAKFVVDDNGVKKRYYYPISFCFDLKTKEFSGMKILACRNDFPEGESKREDLYHVIYPGGIIRNKNGTAKLYVGVGDAESYIITIKDPFKEYEK